MADKIYSQLGFEPEISPIVMVDKPISGFPIDTGSYQPIKSDLVNAGLGFSVDNPTASQVFDGKTLGKLALILGVVIFLIYALGKGMGK